MLNRPPNPGPIASSFISLSFSSPFLGCPTHRLQNRYEGGTPQDHPRVANIHLRLLRDQMFNLSRLAILSNFALCSPGLWEIPSNMFLFENLQALTRLASSCHGA